MEWPTHTFEKYEHIRKRCLNKVTYYPYVYYLQLKKHFQNTDEIILCLANLADPTSLSQSVQ
jgi:hypothetical protein